MHGVRSPLVELRGRSDSVCLFQQRLAAVVEYDAAQLGILPFDSSFVRGCSISEGRW